MVNYFRNTPETFHKTTKKRTIDTVSVYTYSRLMTTEPISRGDRIKWQHNGVTQHGRVENIARGFYLARSDQGARDALRRPDMTKERT